MPANKKKNNTNNILQLLGSHIRKVFTLNIGTILFGALLLYMLITFLLYLTSTNFTSYQVTSGPLSRNGTYTGLAIHKEEIVQADAPGYLTYYTKEGAKVNATGIVYGVSESESTTGNVELSQEVLAKVRQQMSSYSNGFDSTNFNSIYNFKYDLEGSILQYAETTDSKNTTTDSSTTDTENSDQEDTTTATTDASISKSSAPVTIGNQTVCKASEDGIVLYSEDGYETKTADTLTASDFDQNSYHKVDLKDTKKVETGDDVYTLITDERWSLYIPLSEKQATQLEDRTSVKVKFLKDDNTLTGDFSIIEIDDGKYGKIDFSSGLIRYASDRFLDIELVTNIQSGLKIPLSSVVSKDFYLIPTGYQTVGGNDDSAGFLLETSSKKGESSTKFVSATLYSNIDDMYYVDTSLFKEGDVLVKPNSTERYVIGDTSSLEGVYCINKGYAVFRAISIIDQNEEYCIVEKGNTYGLAQYDHIVMDASKVKEQDILY